MKSQQHDHGILGMPRIVITPPMSTCQQAPDSDSTMAYLALCLEALDTAIAWLLAASRDARVDESLCSIELKQLRGIRDAVEAEMEARHAQP